MPELELCKVDQIYYIGSDPEIFDFLHFDNFRPVNDISEQFHMAVTKLGILSFNLRYWVAF
jgi:hypothetical protein